MGRGLLILISGLVIVFGIIQKSMLERQGSVLPARSSDYINEQQTLNLSNGIVDAVVSELKRNKNWDAGDSKFSLPEGYNGEGWVKIFDQDSPADSLPPNHEAGDQSTWGDNVLLFWSQVSLHGYTAQTEVKMLREPFSRYSYFTNYEPSSIYFYSSDSLYGPVHTNGTLQIAGEPVFHGKVSSPNFWQGHPDYANNPQFMAGTDFSAPTFTLPGTDQMNTLINAASGAGLKYQNPIRVIMEESGGSGTVQIYETSGSSEIQYTLSEGQYDGKVISSDYEVKVKGRLKGSLTIHSGTGIEIIGDLQYYQNPLTNPASTNILGLVSQGNIRVDENAHTVSGTSDLTLHATLLALSNSFYVENYGSGSPRGALNLVGGIVQKEHGPVGTFDSGGLASGYSKNYKYDERMRDLVPPKYPRHNTFSYVYWKENIVERPSDNP